MKKFSLLKPSELSQKTNTRHFKFKTTAEVKERVEFVGQSRAIEAVQFGVRIKKEGYNLFAMGPSGIGKRLLIYSMLEAEARSHKAPSDWCYIHNFEDPQKPIALELPSGHGHLFRQDMEILVEDLCTSIPIIFESEEYRSRMQKISDALNNRQEKLLKDIKLEAEKKGLVIVSSPEEFTILPADSKGRAISTENFAKLGKKKRDKTEELISHFTDRLTGFLKHIPRLHKEQREKEKNLKKEFTLMATGHFIDDLKKKYRKFKAVIQYLNAVRDDVIEHVQDFLKRDEPAQSVPGIPEKSLFTRYQVNILVDHAKTKGAPIIYEENPSYSNLICKIEHVAQFGTLSTDFTLIKPSALHKANGGYLIMDAAKILQDLSAWEGLKRALYARNITLEPPEPVGTLNTVSLEPIPIPLNIKVILLGDRATHYLLAEADPNFDELFKVAVDFDEYVVRTSENLRLYASLIATVTNKEELCAFDRTAVAAVIDYSARLAQDAEKLTTHMRSIHDIIREADYWARKAKQHIVQAIHVKQAIAAKIRRLDRVRESLYQDVYHRITLISLGGKKVGQINGLIVLELGNFSFGYPCRITARVRLGDGQVLDIEREAEMSGPIHSKGVLILSGFLAGRYMQEAPFSLSASLVFEQTYNMVDGDSASVAELCALISAIADVPISQSLAVTGSVNQYGQIQAIGSVNEKIEGFFDICQAEGLTGKQGVIIPAANVRHLMLKDEVVLAAANKKFRIYAVHTIDDVVTLLTGMPAGKRGKNKKFPRGTVNELVERRLVMFAKKEEASEVKKLRKKLR